MATSSTMTTVWTEKRTLQHPFHEHALILRELSEDCEVWCFLCKQHFRGGPTYCCEDCDFVLHQACAFVELPPVIQEHPYHHHPGHPLSLSLQDKSYRCSGCGFSLDVTTTLATRPLSQDAEEDGIREHRMSSSWVEIVLRVQRHLRGRRYEPQSCQLLLHEVYARLDLEIQHPLHRQHPLTLLTVGQQLDKSVECRVCNFFARFAPAYCCKECGFALHLQCTVLTMHSSSSAIEHFSHKHPLTPLHVLKSDPTSEKFRIQFSLRCTFCRLNISGVEAYACIDCSFFIHKSCADNLPKEILQHPFHSQHPRLLLLEEGSRECDSCSEDTASGVAFSCGDCEFNLHRSCALEPLSAIEEEAAPVYISYFYHEHPLRLAHLGSTIRCKVCNDSVDCVGYGCITCRDFCLHRSCANLPQKLQHELHPQHQLVLSKPPARHFFCFACQDKHEGGLAFYCSKCQFYMGAGCASSNATLKHPRHEHRLTYHEKTSNKLQCSCCGKRCWYDSYCCMRCNFNLHRDCLDHLPPTIDHKSHRHPLQLSDKFVYGRPDDQYCDYCEMIRNPDHGVYRCEECEFSAHIGCMISDYEEEEDGSVTIGSSKSNQLNVEIASVKADIETKRRDLEAMDVNLQMLVDALAQIQSGATLTNGEHCNNSPSMASVFPDNGLKSIFHEHSLSLRILSDNCEDVRCHLCIKYIHGPCYCCETCDFFLHGSCAVLELPLEIQHPFHSDHPLTLHSGVDYYIDSYYYCRECKDAKHLHALTAIATLPPQDDEKPNEDAKEDEDEHNMEESEREGEDDKVEDNGDEEEEEKEDRDDSVQVEEIIRYFAHKEHPKEDVVTAVATVVVDEGIVRHFSHTEHPLVSFHVEMQLPDRCGLCNKPIFGRFYGCQECIFLIHASCVELPGVIHHHPFGSGLTLAQCSNDVDKGRCGICADDIGGRFAYCHLDGSGWPILELHIQCALSTGFPQGHSYTDSSEFKAHPLHPCPLVFCHIEPGTYSPVHCKVCLLEISGEALACPECWFTLHKSCGEMLPEVLQHFLHSEHSLKIMREPRDKDYQCASCQKSDCPTENDIEMIFRCKICEFYLHPYCALQTLSAVEEGAATSISHFTHHHPLQLHFRHLHPPQVHFRTSGLCVVCEHVIYGLAYSCPTCHDTNLHKSCAEMSQELDHPYHPEHLLVLCKSTIGYFHCSVYHKNLSWDDAYAYCCSMCEFYLDVGCATLELTLKHPRHEHRLAYFTKYDRESDMPCNACRKICKIDLYVCVLCDFRLHYDCLPLLPKIKHEGHQLHTLFLKDKIVDGDPNYQYCDHCETLRNPDHGVYHCEECWFSAHIDCMLSKDKVEEQEQEPDVLVETSVKAVGEEAPSEVARLKEVIDVTRMSIETMRGSLEALMEKLRELEVEKGRV